MSLKSVAGALMEGATVVTVNDRLARRLRELVGERYRGAGEAAWETPPVLPFGAWLTRLYAARRDAVFGGAPACDVQLLTPAQTEAVWARLIRDSAAGGGLLQPWAAAETAAEAWRLCQAWRVPLARLGAGGDDGAAFVAWARTFDAQCARKGWLDASRLPDWLRDELAHLKLPQRLIFAGFDEWTPQQAALLNALSERGVTVEREEMPPAAARAPIPVAAPDADAELALAARWAAAALRENPAARIGVVIPDLATRREAAVRAIAGAVDPAALAPAAHDQPLPVNVSLGGALAAAPLVHDALLAFDCVGGAIELASLSRLLRSPFIGGAKCEGLARAALDATLRDRGEARVLARTLHAFAETTGCELWQRHWDAFNAVLASAPRTAGPRAWAETFDAALTAFGWPGERPLDSAEFQTVEAFAALLADFARLEPVIGAPLGVREALGLLRRLAARRDFQPRRPAAPVQVLGVLEAAGLDFDRLWVAGFDDRRWPARLEPNPFIPLSVQREYGLPHASAERELEFAAAITGRLFAAAPEVVVSWPEREGDVALRASPLIGVRGSGFGVRGESEDSSFTTNHLSLTKIGTRDLGLGTREERDDPSSTANHLPLTIGPGLGWRELIRRAGRLETLADDRVPALAAGAVVHGGTGLLKDQAACPFQAFARRRLGAKAPAAPAPGLDPMLRGQLVHTVLQLFWEAVGNQANLKAMNPEARQAAVEDAVTAALAQAARRYPATLTPRLRALEQARLSALLVQWLDCELARAPFEVVAREAKTELAIGGLTLNFRIDRVDAVAGGEAVIDYKTGHVSGGVWEGERPDEPQLPAYALARGGAVDAVLFARLRAGELGYVGVAADTTGVAPLGRGSGHADLGAMQLEWRETLSALAAAFRDGDARVDPKDPDKTCARCDLHALCRIAERSA